MTFHPEIYWLSKGMPTVGCNVSHQDAELDVCRGLGCTATLECRVGRHHSLDAKHDMDREK